MEELLLDKNAYKGIINAAVMPSARGKKQAMNQRIDCQATDLCRQLFF